MDSVTCAGRENKVEKTSPPYHIIGFGPHSLTLNRTGGGLMGVYVDQSFSAQMGLWVGGCVGVKILVWYISSRMAILSCVARAASGD